MPSTENKNAIGLFRLEEYGRRKTTPVNWNICLSKRGSYSSFQPSEREIYLGDPRPHMRYPVIIPAIQDMGPEIDHSDYIDGLLLTGSPSNVRPVEYSGTPSVEGTKHDVARDKTMIPLIRRCLQKKIPILGLCLGIQELNVACGGSLHQRIFDLEDKFDHRMRRDVDDHAKRYRPAHNIRITKVVY